MQATVYFPAKEVYRRVLQPGPYPCSAKGGKQVVGRVGVDTAQQEHMPPLEQAEVGRLRVVVVAGSYCTRSEEGYGRASQVVSLVYSGKRWKQDQTMASHYL